MSTIKANTLLHSDGTTTTQPSIPALDQRMAKAWVNFNGTGTVAIRDSYNVSSITDIGTGNYRIDLTSSLDNNNYSVVSSIGGNIGFARVHNLSTTTVQLLTYLVSQALTDVDTVCATIFGD